MESMEMISAPIFSAKASPIAVFPTAVGPVRHHALAISDIGLVLTRKTKRATLRHLLFVYNRPEIVRGGILCLLDYGFLHARQ